MEHRSTFFGKWVKEEREKLGISREDFARQNSITYSALSMYERGERHVRDELKIKIAKNLNISMEYLLGIIDTPLPYTDKFEIHNTIRKNANANLTPYSKLRNSLQQNDIISSIESEITDERIKAIVYVLKNNIEVIDILEKKYKEENNND